MQDDLLYPLNRSLCKHCEHKITREISSEGFVFTQEDGAECDEDLDSFIHDACILLGVDLDHIVLDCSKFVRAKDTYDGKRIFIKSRDILDKVHKN